MGDEWIETTLGEVLTLQRGFDLPVSKRLLGPYPVVASTGEVGKHNEALVRGPGVVIGRSGSIGGGQYIKSDFWPLNTTLWVKDFKGNDPRFCYYLVKSVDFSRFNAGSGVPTLNRNHIHPLPVNVPASLPEQRAIAAILGALDDKIELNRRMNETLEAMAQALFKSWFVDFDPFREQGMEDSPLGPIPMGWRVGIVNDLGAMICGKTPPTQDHDNYGGNIPFITIPDMHGKVFVTVTGSYLSPKGASTQPKKLLPQNAVCVSCIATPGLVALTSQPSHTNQQINSVVCDSTTSPYWCYLAMTNLRQEIITGGAGGSATLNLNKAEFSKLQLVKPNSETMWNFHSLVEALFSRILSNDLESNNLANIRDTLLPKLLSGETLVKDTEKFVETVS